MTTCKRQRPGRRFALVTGGIGLLLLPLYRSPRLFDFLAPLELWTAKAAAALVGWCGMAVERDGVLLHHPGGFSCEIYYSCTGLFLAVFLAAGVLALPGRLASRLAAAALGVAIVFAVNLVRLASLFYIGAHFPAAFDFAHEIAWEAAMLGLVLGYWIWRLDHLDHELVAHSVLSN